jgi:hypothetical protein
MSSPRHCSRPWTALVLALGACRSLAAVETAATAAVSPNPTELLRAVAEARLHVASCAMDLEIGYYRFERPKAGTNHVQVRLVFDGNKRRLEEFSRDGVNNFVGEEAGAALEVKLRDLEWDFEAVVRLGLARWQDAHAIIAYDGTTLVHFQEQDGRHGTVTIVDPARPNLSAPAFDPRVLGLTPFLSFSSTVENSLRPARARDPRLIGREVIDARECWHIAVEVEKWDTLDFWLDAAQPTRVRQMRVGSREIVVSRYDGAAADDALPTEIVATSFRNGTPWFETRTLRRHTTLPAAPFDNSTWTLAGLALPVGTPVNDNRIHCRIGYWDGRGFSKEFVAAAPAPADDSPPDTKKLLALIAGEPATPIARESAVWIVLNTPDGPDVDRAAEFLIARHAASPKLASLCLGLEDNLVHVAPKLLRAILAANTDADVQTCAAFSLAMILKHEATEGTADAASIERAATEAEALFGRIGDDNQKLASDGRPLGERAERELFELRTLRAGKIAPDIVGEDLDGRKFKLSDYRDKVVVLTFWGT